MNLFPILRVCTCMKNNPNFLVCPPLVNDFYTFSYLLMPLLRSSGAALSPLVCLSALNFGGVLPMAVALGFPLGPLVLPDPATAEQPSPVWWLLALLALPACFFGFFDLQSRPAFDVLARSLEFYQVMNMGKSARKVKSDDVNVARNAPEGS